MGLKRSLLSLEQATDDNLFLMLSAECLVISPMSPMKLASVAPFIRGPEFGPVQHAGPDADGRICSNSTYYI